MDISWLVSSHSSLVNHSENAMGLSLCSVHTEMGRDVRKGQGERRRTKTHLATQRTPTSGFIQLIDQWQVDDDHALRPQSWLLRSSRRVASLRGWQWEADWHAEGRWPGVGQGRQESSYAGLHALRLPLLPTFWRGRKSMAVKLLTVACRFLVFRLGRLEAPVVVAF